MTTTPTDSQLDLRDFLSILWVRKWWIIVTAFVLAVGSYVNSFLETKLYTAAAEVVVFPVAIPGSSETPTFVIMAHEVRVAASAEVRKKAEELVADSGHELGSVGVENPPDSASLVFTAVSTVPEAASASANAYADAYLAFRKTGLTENVAEQIKALTAQIEGTDEVEGLNERIAELQQDLLTASDVEKDGILLSIQNLQAQVATYQAEISDLQLLESAPVGQKIQEAVTPGFHSSPRPRRAGILGGFIGLLLGTGLAFLRDRLDRRLRGRRDIESSVEAPVLAMIPRVPSLHDQLAVGAVGDPAAAEAFRTLRTRVQFAASREPFTTMMITSAQAGEGKTTTAANLATALAQTDAKVILVGADLRRPGLQRYFAYRGLGLGDVLSGAADLSEVIVRTDTDNLLVVPSGSPRNAPEGGLAANTMANILARLSAQSDYVVIDSPPILGVSDGLDLASLVDTVIVVVDASRSQKDAIEETANDLRSVGATLLGVVLSHFDPGKFNPYYRQGRYGANYRYIKGDEGRRGRASGNGDRGEVDAERGRTAWDESGDAGARAGSRDRGRR